MLAVITVTSTADNFAVDGIVTLREAIVAANTNMAVGDAIAGDFGLDTINFDASLSGQTIALALGGGELEITEELTIDAAALAQNVTIDAAGSVSRIFNITATIGNFTLAGLTLIGGRATGIGADFRGGGAIRSLTTGSLTIDQSTISGNISTRPSYGGGGIFASGDVTLTNSIVSGNSATDPSSGRSGGGGIRTSSGDVTLNNSTVSDNESDFGGGIFASGDVTLNNSIVSDNRGNQNGGGISTSSGDVTLNSSTVSGNSTTNFFGLSQRGGGGISTWTGVVTLNSSTVSDNSTVYDGGGISTWSGAVTLTNSTVSGNSSADAGGGIWTDSGAVTLNSSTVSDNSTVEDGGGIRAFSGDVTLTSSTVSGNSATGLDADGGGIFTGSGDLTLTSSTVSGNSSADDGGGIWSFLSTITITNSILAGNTADGDRPDIRPGAGAFTVHFSLIGSGVTDAGVGNLVNNAPLLGPLQNNGGPTETHALLLGSMAIGAGNAAIAGPPPEFDQRGAPFVRQNGTIDMGAYEIQTLAASFFVVTTTTDELDYSNSGVSLREAIHSANGSFGANTIIFDAAVFTGGAASLIRLGGTELTITDTLTIDGSTGTDVVITADADGDDVLVAGTFITDVAASGAALLDDNSRIFNITAASGNFTFAGLTLTSGRTTGSGVDFSGGAIRSLTTGSLTVDQSTISGNSTVGDYARGGGIYSSGDVTLTSSTVSGNSTTGARAGGGGMFSSGDVTLTNSTVSGNSTTGNYAYGGGISSSSGAVTLTSSTVSGNSTTGVYADGGGIDSSGTVTLTSSTVTDNRANATGGGIWNRDGTITIANSIVAGNTADDGSPDIRPGTLDVEFSLIGDNAGTSLSEAQTADVNGNLIGSAAGAGVIDPLLGALTNNGGLTETHALLVGSPAIDTGANGPATDQRGVVRPQGVQFDIGAFELEAEAPSLVVTLATDVADSFDNETSLREAVAFANSQSGADTISFVAALDGDTITLAGTELVITEALSVDATSLAGNVTIDANELSRIFNITATSGNFTLAGLTLTGGRTTGNSFNGGAISSRTTGNLTIDQSTISGNSTAGFNAHGGGIDSSGDITLTNSTVSGNGTAGNYAYGGGIFSSGDVTLTSSTVSGNSTTGNYARGGGINSSGDVTLTSSTVSGNSTTNSDADGGGIFSYGDVTLSNSTVTANYAFNPSADGGGIWNNDDAITITNSIVAGNGAGGGSHDINPGTGVFDVDFSLLGTAVTPDAGSSDNKFSDTPLLGPLADNGGPTETHALLAGSLAIDKGDPSILFNPAEFDQRGAPFVRVVGGQIDIGAVEDQPIPVSADFDTDGDVDGADFLAWQRGFGTASPTHSEGDADFDADVDAADLGIWQTNYGSGTPLLAAATSGPSPVASAALIDAAIALSIESSPVDEDFVTETPNVESLPIAVTVFDPTAAASADVPVSDNILADEATENDVTKQTSEPWLTDELLERVFG